MPAHRSTPKHRASRLRGTTTAALAAAGAAAVALTVVPAAADPGAATQARNVGWDVPAAEIPGQSASSAADPHAARDRADEEARTHSLFAQAADRQRGEAERVAGLRAERAAERAAAKRAEAEAAAAAERQAAEEAEAAAAAEEQRAAEEAAALAAEQEEAAAAQAAPVVEPAPAPAPVYPDNLDGWIREALDVMAANGIPGTYDGLYRNIIRESSGDPNAINLWDINAINGTPSIGLLQVIQPTFDAYHVEGTPYDIYDPVANITAAANYAADRYGSIDNVNGPY
ncbi:transglycosylase SLT domain-containing protein [Streptomyces sp. DSM 44917]|uniref:Transglycosylase SLT domain-containing protein n=1 Tax=Streptomyces boetiae TaxID=3075541 RepID=A0ABU2LEW3_9ACTN|nr:transglycosylase SLT domain-containing protein [Streptomyces sp. DSM 44917]MDT0309808.1 transglycosylase SLT domain-containing protein [Streptomyces sp. DSM 44917]